MRRYQPLLAGALWGTAYPCLQVILESFAPSQVVFIRVLLGTVFLGGIVVLIDGTKPFQIERAQILPLTFLGVLSVGLFYIFQTIAVWFSTPVNVSFIISTYPVFISIVAPFVLRESVTRTNVAGVVFAVFGAYVIIGGGRILPLFSSLTFLGDLLALGGSLSFMAYLLFNKRWTARFDFDYLTLTFFAHFFSIPLVAAFLGVEGSFTVSSIDPLAIVLLLWLSVVVTAGGLLALNAGLRTEQTHVAALRLLLIPFVSTLLSVMFLGEVLTPPKIIGGLAICVGIVLPFFGRDN